MNNELKKLQCVLCVKMCFLLIQIEIATDTWGGRKGVCCECFKNGNIEEKVFLKQKSFLNEQIMKAEESKKFWEEELKSL